MRNYIGLKFGRLTIIDKDLKDKKKYLCECECGNIKSFNINNLKSGRTKSCGCLNKEVSKIKSIKHNEYDILKNKIRVYDSKDKVFYISKESEWVLKDYCWIMVDDGYLIARIRGQNKNILLHRLLLKSELEKPENEDKVVDHIDGNPSNNCLDNLRIVTNTQNQWNKKLKENHCIFKSNRISNPYRVQIGYNKRYYRLGNFHTIEEARKARDNWELNNEKIQFKFVD